MSGNPFETLTQKPAFSPVVAKPEPAPADPPQPPNAIMVYDFETVPDESRFPRPTFDPSATSCPGLDVVGFFGIVKTLTELNNYLSKNPLSRQQYDDLLETEKKAEKPRTGAIEAITKTRDSANETFTAWAKDCSTNPFKAKIVAFGWAIGTGPVQSMTATNEDEERAIVRKFYELVATGRRRAGYNILGFDDLLVAVRAMILDVEPTIKLSRKKYGNSQALDLMGLLFPNSTAQKLKDVCASLRIHVPAGVEMDGSKVFDLYHAGEMQKIAEYVASDVSVERELMWKLLDVFSE